MSLWSPLLDYQQAVAYLYARLPMFQREGKSALHFKLDRIEALMDYLGNPQLKYPTLHVAGTNGKGSVSHSIASVLQEAGYSTGLYTSPHLIDFRERIRLSGSLVSQERVLNFVNLHREYIESHRLSFFELTVAMAFDTFAKEQIDIAVIEVGMGGRLDATNVIYPLLSVITNIAFDHMEFLGDTLAKIAGEKAGIIKPNTPVIIGEYHEETFGVFEAIARTQNAELFTAWNNKEAQELVPQITFDLQGAYQKSNRLTAITALLKARELGLSISDTHITLGLARVIANTGLKGRWQWLNTQTVCDTAHNEAGLAIVMQQLRSLNADRLHLVIGVVADKDLTRVLPLFIKEAYYYFVKPNVPRGLEAIILAQQAREYQLIGEVYASVNEGLQAAKSAAAQGDIVFVGGSTFTVAEVV